jgi:hypothetical protein
VTVVVVEVEVGVDVPDPLLLGVVVVAGPGPNGTVTDGMLTAVVEVESLDEPQPVATSPIAAIASAAHVRCIVCSLVDLMRPAKEEMGRPRGPPHLHQSHSVRVLAFA